MKVIAIKRGFDNVTIREEGDEFDMPEGAKGSWFKAVGKPGKKSEQGDKPEADKAPDADKVDASKLA